MRPPRATTARLIVWTGILAVGTLATSASAQTDAQLIAEGRQAMDTFKDCSAAEKALLQVSTEGMKDPQWLYEAGRAQECLGKKETALKYFLEYDRRSPGDAEALAAIGRLRYRLRQQADARAAERERIVGTYAANITMTDDMRSDRIYVHINRHSDRASLTLYRADEPDHRSVRSYSCDFRGDVNELVFECPQLPTLRKGSASGVNIFRLKRVEHRYFTHTGTWSIRGKREVWRVPFRKE